MNLDLKNKAALVCGSTQGIGEAIAKELALLGCKVILFARNEEKLKHVLTTLHASSDVSHDYLVADFSKPEAVRNQLLDYLKSHDSPEILINNTGGPSPGSLIDESYDKFDETFKAHIACSHYLAQTLVPNMKETGYGRIINVISTSVYMPIVGLGVSNTTRGAMASWAKTLSLELGGFGITVNNVLPGLTATGRLDKLITNRAENEGLTRDEMKQSLENTIPAGRFGKPEEVAAAAAFLASPAAAYINGVSLAVDGGKIGAI